MRYFSRRRVAICLLLGLAIGASYWIFAAGSNRSVASAEPALQCGHWVTLRTCELLGAPVGLEPILDRLPPREAGHSMAEIAALLSDIGLATDGRRELRLATELRTFPCIAHVREPEEHFVVVAGVDEGRVHVFDGAGRRTAWSAEDFQQRWSGNVLYVERDPAVAVLPKWRSDGAAGPRVQFATLFVDPGSIPYNSKSVRFKFPFANRGASDLTIEEVLPDCSCLEVHKPEGPIAPGASGEIELVYRLSAKAGPFFHQVVVETDDVDIPSLKLKVAGFVDRGVVVSPPRIELADVVPGKVYRGLLSVRYTGDLSSFDVNDVSSDLKDLRLSRRSWKHEDLQAVLPGLEAASTVSGVSRSCFISFEYQCPENVESDIQGELTIETNMRGFERIPVPFSARRAMSQSDRPKPVVLTEG